MTLKILYLYSELAGYQMPVFRQYTTRYAAEVHVVSWDRNKLKPYTPAHIDNVFHYPRSQFDKRSLLRLADELRPDIVYVSGWMDKGYLYVTRQLRKQKVPVVTGFDDRWQGTLRQRIASLVFPLVKSRFFSHAWVAGACQYEFAKRIGFKNNEIIFNLLSCDSEFFSKGKEHLETKRLDYPKNFLYVGNFRSVKGTDILVEAFKLYRGRYGGDWGLTCVGNGELQSLLLDVPGLEVLGFTDQEGLLEIAKRSGAFVLPSRSEQWGVVVHEFTCAALPFIVSDSVGSLPTFFINNLNGLSYGNDCPDELAQAMLAMSTRNTEELVRMGRSSFELSQRITPAFSAASFLSVLAGTDRREPGTTLAVTR